jgi:hypothetical protein
MEVNKVMRKKDHLRLGCGSMGEQKLLPTKYKALSLNHSAAKRIPQSQKKDNPNLLE